MSKQGVMGKPRGTPKAAPAGRPLVSSSNAPGDKYRDHGLGEGLVKPRVDTNQATSKKSRHVFTPQSLNDCLSRCTRWVSGIIPLPPNADIVEELKDGSILCRLLERLQPGACLLPARLLKPTYCL